MSSKMIQSPLKQSLMVVVIAGGTMNGLTAWAESFDTFTCDMMQAEIQRPNGAHVSELHCMVGPDGRPDLVDKIFKLDNLPAGFAAQYQAALEKAKEKALQTQAHERLTAFLAQDIGPLRLQATEVTLGPDDSLVFSNRSRWTFESTTVASANTGADSSTAQSGSTTTADASQDRSVLVVRVIAPDAETSLSTVALSDEVFGTLGDPVNLASQFRACSYDTVNFTPATGDHIVDGVVEVTIDELVTGTSNGVIRNAVSSALTEKLGYSATSRFEHVMYALPPGTDSGWIAYAYVNSSLSVYNNQWAGYVSAQMHEIGHNLGLSHSGEGSSTYGDQSGMMGFSYSRDDGPIMCFNAAKSAFLSWYDDKKAVLNPGETKTFTLSGAAEYNNILDDQSVILNINGNQSLYLTFNAAKGINSGTGEGKNRVMVVQQEGVEQGNYNNSTLLAKLAAGETFAENNFDGAGTDLIVTVDTIGVNAGTGYDFATVTVNFGDAPPNQAPEAQAIEVTGTENTPLDITLDGSDPNGDALTYTIVTQPGNGTLQGSGQTVTYTPLENLTGTDTFTYEVTDGELTSDVATVTVTINAEEEVNEPPVAAFTVAPTSPLTNEIATFDASGSMDLDGMLVNYVWDFGDGQTATGVTANHSYASAGNYAVTLTVTDDGQLSSSTSQTISVTQPVDPDAEPAAPSNLSAFKEGGKNKDIVLNWVDNANNETLFEIERAELFGRGKSESQGPWQKVGETSANTTTFTDQPKRGRYIYRVRARNDNGPSSYSTPSDFITL